MDKAATEAATAVLQAEPAVAVTGLAPWQPRSDGKRALLVSERATVFDRPAAPCSALPDPGAFIADPIWDHKGGTTWTPDLVHARLVVTGEVIRRMPPVLRTTYVSQLGSLAISEMTAARRIAPTPEEITLADWTLVEIMARRHRQILLASAFGYSGDRIAKALQARGERVAGTTVQARYLAERRVMAGAWQGRRVPIGALTLGRWQEIFEARRK